MWKYFELVRCRALLQQGSGVSFATIRKNKSKEFGGSWWRKVFGIIDFEFAQLPPKGKYWNSYVPHSSPFPQAQLFPCYLQQFSLSGSGQWHLIFKSSDCAHSSSLLPLGLCSRLSHQKKRLIKRSCVKCITKLNSIKSSTCKIEKSWSSSVMHLDHCWFLLT